MVSILGRLFGADESRSLENPKTSLSDPDEWLYDALGGRKSKTGVRVNRKTAMTYGPVFRAVNIISRYTAKTPLLVYRREDGGKERATEHNAYHLLRHKANSEMTAFQLKLVMTGNACLGGRGYAFIDRDGAGGAIQLIWLNPETTYPVRENGKLWYVVTIKNEMRKLRPEDVFDLKGLGYDGLNAYSVVRMGAESFGLGMATEEYGARFFLNNARPSVVLETPQTLSEGAIKRLKKSWPKMYGGLSNAHKTAILEEGLKANALSVNASDAQLIETRKFQIVDVANFFGIPPHMLGDDTSTSYNSLEQVMQSLLNDALDFWFCAWEDEAREKLFTEEEKRQDSHVVQFKRQALVRAEMKTRADYYRRATGGAPWMLIDEVRSEEGMNALAGGIGKQLIIPLNMSANASDDLDEEAEDDRQNLVAAHRQIMSDTLARMARRIGTKARRAANQPDTFDDWIDACRGDHIEVVREAAMPILQAACHSNRDQVEPVMQEILSQFFDTIRTDLDATLDAKPEQLAQRVDEAMTTLEQTLPVAVAIRLN